MAKKMNFRKNTRHRCYVPVDAKKGTAFHDILTLDISREGMGLLSHRKVPLDEEIAVELDLNPGQEPILVMGRIVWVKRLSESEKYRLGMKFTDKLSSDATSRLKKQYPK